MPESRLLVISVQSEPFVLLCHCVVVANKVVDTAVKVASLPTQIELGIGYAVIVGVPVEVPTAKSPKSTNPFAIAEVADGVATVTGANQEAPSYLRTTKLEGVAETSLSKVA